MIILVEDVRDDFGDDTSKIISVFDNFKQVREFLDTYHSSGALRWEIWSTGKRQPDQLGEITKVEQPRTYKYSMTVPNNMKGWDRDYDPSAFLA